MLVNDQNGGTPTATYLPPAVLARLRELVAARQSTIAALIRRLILDEIKYAEESGELV